MSEFSMPAIMRIHQLPAYELMMLKHLLLLSLTAPAVGAVDFVKDIQPILSERCYSCHGPNKQEAALRLDHKPSALKGGDSDWRSNRGMALIPFSCRPLRAGFQR